MLPPATLLRIFTEVIFILLGAGMIWAAAALRFEWDRRSPLWIAVGAVLVYWGARAWARAGRYATRWPHLVRGGSLMALGAVMLAIAALPMEWSAPLLGVAGAIITLRGVAGAILLARTP